MRGTPDLATHTHMCVCRSGMTIIIASRGKGGVLLYSFAPCTCTWSTRRRRTAFGLLSARERVERWPSSHRNMYGRRTKPCSGPSPKSARVYHPLQIFKKKNKFSAVMATCMKEKPNGGDFSIDCDRLFKQLLDFNQLNAERSGMLPSFNELRCPVSVCVLLTPTLLLLFQLWHKVGHEVNNSPPKERRERERERERLIFETSTPHTNLATEVCVW